jgi:AcrR family transcriptional regulator
MGGVKSGRKYTSQLRQRQARATRGAVLAAATALFLERGYGGTTIELVADRAGVSKPTVFAAVGNKQELLKAVRDVAIAGEDADVPVAEQQLPRAAAAAPDLETALGLLARHLTGVADRYAGIFEVVRGAAAAGQDQIADLWRVEEEQRLIGAQHWVDLLRSKGRLRPGLSRGSAVDQVWLLMAPDNFTRLVKTRGWERRRYERWLRETIGALWA